MMNSNYSEVVITNIRTCFAAIREDPTTFPLLSNTSIPSDISLCLIRATLQMFALAKKKMQMLNNSHQWISYLCNANMYINDK